MKKNIFSKTILLFVLLLISCGTDKGKDIEYDKDETTIDVGQQLAADPDWYKDAVFYHLWVKAFKDSVYDDDIGDIRGIINKLDYLNDGDPNTDSDLGITAIWLSPIFDCSDKKTSPENMHGYHTTDYFAINNRFGKNADIKELLDEAHARGIRVVFDYVINHTSVKHSWFKNSSSDGDKRDWYVWQDTPSALWQTAWDSGNWQDVWKRENDSYFYTVFTTDHLADLNFKNNQVRAKMKEIAKYWLDRGFDGMRIDAIRYLVENGPGDAADVNATHTYFKELRTEIVDSYNAAGNSKVMFGEAWTTEDEIGAYYGNGNDEFHMCLDFPIAFGIQNLLTPENDPEYYNNVFEYEKDNYPAGYRSASFVSNHDSVTDRPMTKYDNKQKVILAAALNILSPATPIVYYGNEIGMTGTSSPDTGMRRNMDWSAVKKQTTDSDSVLSWYRYLIKTRKKYAILNRGSYQQIDTNNDDVRAFLRKLDDKAFLIIGSISESNLSINLDMSGTGLNGVSVAPIISDLNAATTISDSYNVSVPAMGLLVYYIGSDAGSQERIY